MYRKYDTHITHTCVMIYYTDISIWSNLNLGYAIDVIDYRDQTEIDYSKYDAMHENLKNAEKMSNEATKIIVKWDKITANGKPTYQRFYGPQFLLQISGSGLVAPSGMFFNARYSKFHIGNFIDERFKNIFKSERYWKIMEYLSSPAFDAQSMMGTLPIQHYVSEALDNHAKGIVKIKKNNGEKPMHVNFL